MLGRTDEAISWQSIAVRSDAGGRPSIELTGAAPELAQRRGMRSLDVSLTHDEPFAAAVVLAELGRMTDSLKVAIRQVLRDHARLPVDVETVPDDADLFQAGMTSHASVNVMLALEDAFDIEFPDRC